MTFWNFDDCVKEWNVVEKLTLKLIFKLKNIVGKTIFNLLIVNWNKLLTFIWMGNVTEPGGQTSALEV